MRKISILLTFLSVATCVKADISITNTLTTSANEANLKDGNNDGIGDEASSAWNFYLIGESATDANTMRGWLPFSLSAAQKAFIAGATKIELEFYTYQEANIDHTPLDLYGYSSRTTEVAVPGDYHAADLALVRAGIMDSSVPRSTKVSVDVTDFVKSQATSFDMAVFQLRLQDESKTSDGLSNYYLLYNSKNSAFPGYPRLVITKTTLLPPPVGNSKTQLEFFYATEGGGISQITDLGSGFEFINRADSKKLWSMTLAESAVAGGLPEWAADPVSPVTAEGFADDFGEQGTLTISSDQFSNGTFVPIANGLRFSWTDIDVAGEVGVLDVSIDIVLDPSDDFARFTASFINRSTNYTVFSLTAPVVEGIYPADGVLSDDRLAMPLYFGRLTHNPIQNGVPTGGGTSSVSYQPNRGGHSMQFDAYYHNEHGLYMGAFDGDQNAARYRIGTDGQTGISWGMVHIPNNMFSEPQAWTTPYDTVVRCFDGDWYDACSIYRSWAKHQRWASLGKVADRTDIPLWFKEMDGWITWNDSYYITGQDMIYSLLSDFNMGCFSTSWGKDHHFDEYSPERFPLDARSTDFINRQTAAGWPIIPYIQSIIWDKRSAQFTTYDGSNNLVKNISGQNLWGSWYGDPNDASIASPTPQWEAALGGTIQQMAAHGYKSTYLDSGNWGGALLNFNPALGSDVGGGNDYIHHHQQMLRNIKTNARQDDPGHCFAAESFWEGNIDVIDAQLAVNTTHRYLQSGVVEALPMLPAVYHDYAMYFGVWVGKYDLELDGGKAYIAKYGQFFVDGGKSGRNQHRMLLPDPYIDNFTNNERALASSLKRYAAYAGSRKFLTYGEMLRPPGFTTAPPMIHNIKWHRGWTALYFNVSLPSVLISYWKAPDGSYGLVLYNISDSNQPVTVSLKESDYDAEGGYFSANRIYPEPVQAQSVVRVLEGTNWTTQITVTVPPDSPMVFELELDTNGNGIPNSQDDDDDADGMSDVDEEIAGTNPLDPSSLFKIEGSRMEGGDLTLVWSSAPWKSYDITGANSLTNTFNVIQQGIPSAGESTSNEVPLPTASDAYFYRIKVE